MYYKRHADNSITAAEKVFGPGFSLDETTTAQTADGWAWFDTPEDAYAYYATGGAATIRAWQAKAVLELSGLLPAAVAAIDALAEPDRTVVKSAWDNNADFSRQSSTVIALAAALNLTEPQLDAMFEQAAALTV